MNRLPQSNIVFDACGIARAGRLNMACEILAEKFPDASDGEISEAISQGQLLLHAAWKSAEKIRGNTSTVESEVTELHKEFSNVPATLIEHQLRNALFDTR